MPEKINLGFIGCGTHSTNNTYPMLAYTYGRLEAVCDIDEGLACRNAALYGDKSTKVYTDADKMLDEAALEGIMIVGPPDMHYRYGMAALKRGLPVYVEKPPAPNLEKTLEMVEAAKANGTFVMCGFMKRFGTAYKKIREMAESKKIELSTGFFKYSHWSCGDISMMYTMSIHIIDLAISIFGGVKSVYSVCGKPNGNISVTLILHHESGLHTQLMLDTSHPRIHERAEVSGKMDGKNTLITVDNVQHMEMHTEQRDYTFIDVLAPTMQQIEPTAGFDGISVWRPDYAMPNMGQTRHFFQGFAGEAREFVDAVKEKRAAYCSNDDILGAMRVIDAVISKPNGYSEL
ncbi:MAG: Gfo/Idh/MocA family oxidoreductase [Oscillospiraceae bacterium]|nr:Gfo/Idh/MocA family oxidoreductase [Oscillospiraceae bacterium]